MANESITPVSTRDHLRELVKAYPRRFTDRMEYARCRRDLEGVMKARGWPTTRIKREVDDAIVSELLFDVQAILRQGRLTG